MIAISGEIIDRNSAPLDFKATQEIDKQLDEIEAAMPEEWWKLPQERTSPPASLGFGRNQNLNAQFDQLMTQIWLVPGFKA